MKKNKLMALSLSAVMALSMLTGCGSTPAASDSAASAGTEQATQTVEENAAGATDISEHVDLTLYLVGDKPEGFDDVYEKVNEILNETCNATLKTEWLNWGEHETKYPLLFSSGEDFDMIFTATQWCHYEETVSMGGFLPLTEDMLKTYAPETWATVPDVAWQQATINGNIYMLPANFIEVTPEVVAVRGDYMKKYGYDDLTSYDQLIDFYKDCAKDGVYANMTKAPLLSLWVGSLGYATTSGSPNPYLFLYNCNDPSDVRYIYTPDTEEFRQFCLQMKELADMGAWPSDVLNGSAENQDGLISGRACSMAWNSGTCKIYADQANNEHPDWDVNIYLVNKKYDYVSTKYINGGIGINVNSKHPERALMVYNQLLTNQDLIDLTGLGIKDVNWTEEEGGKYSLTDTPYSPSNWWGWRNLDLMRKQYIADPTPVDLAVEAIDQYAIDHVKAPHPLDNFSFDPTPVTTQMAAVQAALSMYYDPLCSGLVDDVDASIAEFKQAMDAAGMQDIIAEMERQIAEYTGK
ncbi:MAG: ABC transporter substrate-binding protein [Lachnospiraceae bacterium]|nr:ABC transporter substrate-binding protein [Lachnospiraceae bacterium]